MNILYIVPNPPSLVRVRPYNLIRHLRVRGNRVTLATVWANAGERDDIEALRANGLQVIAAPSRTSHTSNLKHPIEVLPNGVDLDYFTPGTDARQPETVVFSCKMSYHANITAALYLAHQVMPLVWAQQPNVHLIIAGSRPSPVIRKLAETYPSRVQVTGYLSDLRAPLRQASVAAAPLLYGAGIQNKVLEAMACGTPVVASALAVSALQAQPGQDCLVANSPQTFARAILALLHDPALRERVGTAGRRYVERQHDWNTIAAQLESIYEKSIRDVH